MQFKTNKKNFWVIPGKWEFPDNWEIPKKSKKIRVDVTDYDVQARKTKSYSIVLGKK